MTAKTVKAYLLLAGFTEADKRKGLLANLAEFQGNSGNVLWKGIFGFISDRSVVTLLDGNIWNLHRLGLGRCCQ